MALKLKSFKAIFRSALSSTVTFFIDSVLKILGSMILGSMTKNVFIWRLMSENGSFSRSVSKNVDENRNDEDQTEQESYKADPGHAQQFWR